MTWFSCICLLALTSSAFGRSIGGYGGLDVSVQTPMLTSIGSQSIIPKTILPTNTLVSQSYGQVPLSSGLSQRVLINTPTVATTSYQQQYQQPLPQQQQQQPLPQQQYQQPLPQQQQQQQPIQQSYGAQVTLPRTLPVQSYGSVSQGGYGAVPMAPQHDQSVTTPVLSQADMLCQGHQAGDVIPTNNNRKFVICLDNGKGVEQQCPTGLYYNSGSYRCERTSGSLDDVCSSQPCLNGGQCLSSGSSFQCQCAPGFEGVVCEFDARICQTQQPCGSSPDAKCQSFRLGAALPYICIFQNGLAYGLNTQQIVPSPCQGNDGPQALAVSQNGFIMCDRERLFIESCPGGTIWDNVEQACSWPDQQFASQGSTKSLSSGYGYGSQITPQQQQSVQSYASQTVIPQQQQRLGLSTQSYGAQTLVPQQQQQQQQQLPMIAAKQLIQPVQSYGAQVTVPQQQPVMIAAKQFSQPVQSYGTQTLVPQQQSTMIAAKQFRPTQSYGAQITVPQQQQPTQSYGAQITVPQQQQQQPTQSYGAQVTVPQQQQQTQSYGAQITVPQQQQQQPTQSYGAQIIVPQQQQQQQPTQSYGAQVTVPQQQQQQPTQSYGAQITVPQQQQQQPTQSYGAQTLVPQQQQQQQPTQSYGAQTLVPQQQQSTMIAAKQLIQPTQSYGAPVPILQSSMLTAPKQLIPPTQSFSSTVQVPQAQSSMAAQNDVITLQPGVPYGAAPFPTS